MDGKYRIGYVAFIVMALFVTVITACMSGEGLQTPVQELFPSEDVLKGTTVNGTTYYVYDKTFDGTTEENDVVEFVLLVNVGSVQEEDNQLGLAHFVEHMAFNGTDKYPGNTIISKLAEQNVRFGEDLNAYTDFDHTTFFIHVPNNEENIDLALDILKEWAYHLSYDEEQIEKEKPVVLEEVRAYQETRYKIWLEDSQFILRDSKYAERDPGGKMDVIEHASREVIKQFYDDWYAPNLMAIYVKGDIDSQAIEQKIQTLFSNEGKEAPDLQIPISLGEPHTMVMRKVEDKTQDNVVRLNYMQPFPKVNILSDIVDIALFDAAVESLKQYLSNLSAIQEALVSTSVSSSTVVKGILGVDISFTVPEDQYYEGMKIVFEALATLQTTNFNEEFINTLVEQSIQEDMDQGISYDFWRVLLDYQQVYPMFDLRKYQNIINEELRRRATPQAIRDAINALMGQSDLRLMLYSDREGIIPADEDIRSLFTTTLIDHNVSAGSLDNVNVGIATEIRAIEKVEEDIAKAIGPLRDTNITQRKDADYDEVYYFDTLNGFQVEYHRRASDDITLFMYGPPKGIFQVTDANSMSDYIVRMYLRDMLRGITVADLSVIDFDTYKEQHQINTAVNMGPYQTIRIYGPSDELDAIFKLPYLYFTASSFDRDIMDNIILGINSEIQNIFHNSDAYFFSSIDYYLNKNDPYFQDFFQELRTYTVSAKEIERGIEVYNALMASPQQYNIIVYGDVAPSEIKTYVQKYIANIPQNPVSVQPEYKIIRTTDFDVVEQFEGIEQSTVAISWNNILEPKTIGSKDLVLMMLLESMITIYLYDIIREREGVYYISPYISYEPIPTYPYDEDEARPITGNLEITFATEPSRANELKDKTIKGMEQLRDNPIDQALIDRAKATLARSIEEGDYRDLQYRNYYLMVFTLTNLLRSGGDEVLFDELRNITPDDIQNFLRYFISSNADFSSYILEPQATTRETQ